MVFSSPISMSIYAQSSWEKREQRTSDIGVEETQDVPVQMSMGVLEKFLSASGLPKELETRE